MELVSDCNHKQNYNFRLFSKTVRHFSLCLLDIKLKLIPYFLRTCVLTNIQSFPNFQTLKLFSWLEHPVSEHKAYMHLIKKCSFKICQKKYMVPFKFLDRWRLGGGKYHIGVISHGIIISPLLSQWFSIIF